MTFTASLSLLESLCEHTQLVDAVHHFHLLQTSVAAWDAYLQLLGNIIDHAAPNEVIYILLDSQSGIIPYINTLLRTLAWSQHQPIHCSLWMSIVCDDRLAAALLDVMLHKLALKQTGIRIFPTEQRWEALRWLQTQRETRILSEALKPGSYMAERTPS